MVPGSAASVAAGIWSECSHCVPRQEAKNNVYTWFSLSLLTQSRTPEHWCHKHSVCLSLPHWKCSKIILTYNPDTCVPGDSKWDKLTIKISYYNTVKNYIDEVAMGIMTSESIFSLIWLLLRLCQGFGKHSFQCIIINCYFVYLLS